MGRVVCAGLRIPAPGRLGNLPDAWVRDSGAPWGQRRREHTAGRGPGFASIPSNVNRRTGMGMSFRVILTTGLVALYVAGCLAALSLLLSIWSLSL